MIEQRVAMAKAALSSLVLGYCLVNLKIREASYNKNEILKNEYRDTISFSNTHVQIAFGGPKTSLKLCGQTTALLGTRHKFSA